MRWNKSWLLMISNKLIFEKELKDQMWRRKSGGYVFCFFNDCLVYVSMVDKIYCVVKDVQFDNFGNVKRNG